MLNLQTMMRLLWLLVAVAGRELPLARDTYAILDTGTTGLLISDSLYESDEMPLPGAAVRKMDVEVRARAAAAAAAAAAA